MTARYHVAVLSYDADTRDVVTRAYGDVKVRDGHTRVVTVEWEDFFEQLCIHV